MNPTAIIGLIGTVVGLLCKSHVEPAQARNPANARGESKDFYDDDYAKTAKFAKKPNKNKGLRLRKPKMKTKRNVAA